MKQQRLPEVRQKILGTVIARIKVIFMLDAFSLKLPVKFRGSFVKSEFIVIPAVEINGQAWSPNRRPIPLRNDKGTVLVPVGPVDGIAEGRL
jgi:hypothetical protein